MSTDSKDRRGGGERAPIELKVEYKRLNSFFADYTKNISRGGTFIRTERPLGIGTEFNFKLCVPTLENPLVLRGKVRVAVNQEFRLADARAAHEALEGRQTRGASVLIP